MVEQHALWCHFGQVADAEAEVLVFEPAHTRNTGNIEDETFTAPNGVVI